MFDRPGSVVVLPDATWTDRRTVISSLTDALPEREVVDLAGSPDPQRICSALMESTAPDPVTFISHGPTCMFLPAVALSMRTQHRTVRSYVLIDPHLPAQSEGWPDCPVSVIYTEARRMSSSVRLRGWDWEIASDSTDAILRLLADGR